MAASYNDAQALWPVSGDSLNCSTMATPIMPNTAMTRVCGVQSDRAAAERCCGSIEVRQYQCWLYCEHSRTVGQWSECIYGNQTTSSPTTFCQGEITSNITESLASPSSTSSAFRSSAPKFGWMIFMLVATFLFIGPAQALIVPSLDNGLVKRQSGSGCSLTIESNYTSLQHGSKKVSADFDCARAASSFCAFEVPVVTSLNENNRTLNGSSAAEPEFDAFFDVVSNSTGGRKFPALSSINVTQGFVGRPAQIIALGWTPISFCVNGTVSGCSDTLEAATDGSYFEACGPTYVDNADENSAIGGLFNTITLA